MEALGEHKEHIGMQIVWIGHRVWAAVRWNGSSLITCRELRMLLVSDDFLRDFVQRKQARQPAKLGGWNPDDIQHLIVQSKLASQLEFFFPCAAFRREYSKRVGMHKYEVVFLDVFALDWLLWFARRIDLLLHFHIFICSFSIILTLPSPSSLCLSTTCEAGSNALCDGCRLLHCSHVIEGIAIILKTLHQLALCRRVRQLLFVH